jgi:inhibitor of KinA sporulation pathway (predicted exonuclease)
MEIDNKGNKVEVKPKSKKKRPGSKRRQNRDVALVVDFEATCWRGHPPKGMYNEIIEIGISGVDYKTKEIVFKDTIIVKPEHSEISSFCTELTSIDQGLIDREGVDFKKACQILRDKFKSRDRVWLSWGEYDKNQIQRDCDLKKVENPFGRVHFNLKPLFSFAFGIKQDLGVAGALKHLGIEFEGNAHRAIDDAYNTAIILQKTFIPLMNDKSYNKPGGPKKDYEVLDEFIKETYDENLIDGNVARVINKNTPSN